MNFKNLLFLLLLFLTNAKSFSQVNSASEKEIFKHINSAYNYHKEDSSLDAFISIKSAFEKIEIDTSIQDENLEIFYDTLLNLLDLIISNNIELGSYKIFLSLIQDIFNKGMFFYCKRNSLNHSLENGNKFLRIAEKRRAFSLKLSAAINSDKNKFYQINRKINTLLTQIKKEKSKDQSLIDYNLLKTKEDTLNALNDTLSSLKTIKDISFNKDISSLQSKLSEQDAILYYLKRNDNTYFSLAIVQDSFNIYKLNSKKKFDALFQEYLNAKEHNYHSFQKISYQLYRHLYRPIEELIKNKRRIYLIREGQLNSIPFGSFINKIPESHNGNFGALPFLRVFK